MCCGCLAGIRLVQMHLIHVQLIQMHFCICKSLSVCQATSISLILVISLQLRLRATTCFRPTTTIIIEGYSFLLNYKIVVVMMCFQFRMFLQAIYFSLNLVEMFYLSFSSTDTGKVEFSTFIQLRPSFSCFPYIVNGYLATSKFLLICTSHAL